MIEELVKHSEEIKLWAASLLPEDSDISQPGATIKNLKTPVSVREDLNPPQLFFDSRIRHITYITLLPNSYVEMHNHENASYVLVEDGNYYLVPWDGIEYKTTHLVLETNDEAYFVFGDTRYTWVENKFEILDALHTFHYAENPASTPIRFLYFDYYEN